MTCKICLKLTGVSVAVKQLKELRTLDFTRPDSDVAIELLQETVRDLKQRFISKGYCFRLKGMNNLEGN